MRAGNNNLHGAQIAFFGGSFTAIDREYMVSLLEEGKRLIDEYGLEGIRISTRPDKIDDEILSVLKKYGVVAIELGAQSMDDEVLLANNRGHDAEAVVQASGLIKARGFELGLQMMTGLYMDTDEKAIETAKRIIELEPETVRIYPTITLEGTYLDSLYKKGMYKPQTLDEAVNLCSALIPMFEGEGISVIRVGLHAEAGIETGMSAGPYHPAFKELCISKMFYDRILPYLVENLENTGKMTYTIKVSPKMISAAVGQKRSNIEKLQSAGFNVKFVPCSDIEYMGFEIENNQRG